MLFGSSSSLVEEERIRQTDVAEWVREPSYRPAARLRCWRQATGPFSVEKFKENCVEMDPASGAKVPCPCTPLARPAKGPPHLAPLIGAISCVTATMPSHVEDDSSSLASCTSITDPQRSTVQRNRNIFLQNYIHKRTLSDNCGPIWFPFAGPHLTSIHPLHPTPPLQWRRAHGHV
jgi:hypothetical protein